MSDSKDTQEPSNCNNPKTDENSETEITSSTQTNKNNCDCNQLKHPSRDWTPIAIAILGLIISGIAAYYAYRQTNISEETAHRQLRAYIGVDMQGTHWSQQPDGRIMTEFRIVNYGQTPASAVEISGNVQTLPVPLPYDYQPQYKPLMNPNLRLVIFPSREGIPGTIVSDLIISPSKISNLTSFQSEKRIYLFLSITYRDVFNKDRHTFYSAYLIPSSDKVKLGDNAGWVWNATLNHNTID